MHKRVAADAPDLTMLMQAVEMHLLTLYFQANQRCWWVIMEVHFASSWVRVSYTSVVFVSREHTATILIHYKTGVVFDACDFVCVPSVLSAQHTVDAYSMYGVAVFAADLTMLILHRCILTDCMCHPESTPLQCWCIKELQLNNGVAPAEHTVDTWCICTRPHNVHFNRRRCQHPVTF